MAGQFEFIKDHWIVIEAVDGNDPEPDDKTRDKDKENKDKRKEKSNRKRHRSSDDSDDEKVKKKKRKKKSSKKRSKRKRDSSSDDSDSSDSSDHRRKRKKKSSKKTKSKKSHKIKKDKEKEKERLKEREREKEKEKEREREREREKEKEKEREREREKEKEREREKEKEKEKTKEKEKVKEKVKEKEKEKEKVKEKEKENEKEKEKVKEKEKEKEKEREKEREKEKEKEKEKLKEKEKEREREKEKDTDKERDKSERSKRRRESSVPKSSTSKKSTSGHDDNPCSLIRYTTTKPFIQFCVNVRSVPDIASFSYDSLSKSSTGATSSPSSVKKSSSYSKSSHKLNVNVTPSVKTEQDSDPRHNENNDMSPSEKRALEKLKKQQQKEQEKAVDKKLKAELKTDALATYYSSKKRHPSSSETSKTRPKEEMKSEEKLRESSKIEKDKSTESTETATDAKENVDNETSNKSIPEESNKKMTAKELLDKVRAKKSSESAKQSKLLLTKLPIIGKIRKSNKKDISKNEEDTTPAKDKQDQPVYSIGTDYHWYYRYYMSAYGLDPHSASYYAQYHISTSGEYQNPDLFSWFQNQGYNVLSIPTADQQLQLQMNLHLQSQAFSAQVQPQVQPQIQSGIQPEAALEATPEVKPEVQLQPQPPSIEDNSSEVIIKTEESNSEDKQEINEALDTVQITTDENEGKKDDDTDKMIADQSVTEETKVEGVLTQVDAGKVASETCEKITIEEDILKASESQTEILETKAETMEIEPSDTLIDSEIETNKPVEKLVACETTLETGNKDSCERIQVIVSKIPLSANEMLLASGKSPEPEFYLEDDNEQCDSPSPSPPPPPPPPMRPIMTHLKTKKEICLPNGQKLPTGTEQIIIHPYPSSHPFSNHFNAEAFTKGLTENQQLQENGADLKSTSLSHVIS